MTVAITCAVQPDEVCRAAAARVRPVAAAAANIALTPAVTAAVEAIRTQVAGNLMAWGDGAGGAHVFLESVDLGEPFTQATTWAAFHLPHTLPEGDLYPLWMRPDLSRSDGKPIGKLNATGQNFMHRDNKWLTEPAVMVSLRSNDRDPRIDSPARKLARILDIVRSS